MANAPANPSYQHKLGLLGERPIGITSYKVGSRFSCQIDNVDPGAVIGRASGATREEAIETALANAAHSLKLQDVNDALRLAVEQIRPVNRIKK